MTHSLSNQSAVPDLSRLANSKAMTFLGAPDLVDAASLTPQLVAGAARGKVMIITRIVGNTPGVINYTSGANYGSAGSPTTCLDGVSGIVLRDEDGVQQSVLYFHNFERNLLFGSPDLAAPPDVAIDWAPRHPIVVPSTWEVTALHQSQASTGLIAYGYVVDEEEARAMGFDVNPSTTVADRRLVQTGLQVDSGTQTLAAARTTGQHFMITDIVVRLQPKTDTVATVTITDTSDETIFKFVNSNRANCCEWKIKPEIYLKQNRGVKIVGDANSNGRATVCMVGKWVSDIEVPQDAFYSYAEPQFPSPAATAVHTNRIIRSAATTFTMTYPRSATTATDPGVGRRHHLEGYCFSGAKDTASATQDFVWFALTSGAAAGTDTASVGFSIASYTTGNAQLGPVMSLGAQAQTTSLVVDQINVPGVADTGLIMFEAVAGGGDLVTTPVGATNHIDGWNMTIWGRTKPTEVDPSNNPQFQGGGFVT